jgi:hypothetical protein
VVCRVPPVPKGQLVPEGSAKVIIEASESDNVQVQVKLLTPGTTIGAKIEAQMVERGWNPELIAETIKNPSRKIATRDVRRRIDGGMNDDPATAYCREDGSYVVRSDRTGDVVQVSDRNNPRWVAPWDTK